MISRGRYRDMYQLPLLLTPNHFYVRATCNLARLVMVGDGGNSVALAQ